LTTHDKDIVLPKNNPDTVDYEAELVVVIGKKASYISEEEAMDYMFGYTCANDVSARDVQLKIDAQWARGKSPLVRICKCHFSRDACSVCGNCSAWYLVS
jgi:2-keto-4-pentenoate hydratase/2-oxohepta-3-ene-1,7-dioic acid hydratase in catechol pathway